MQTQMSNMCYLTQIETKEFEIMTMTGNSNLTLQQ